MAATVLQGDLAKHNDDEKECELEDVKAGETRKSLVVFILLC